MALKTPEHWKHWGEFVDLAAEGLKKCREDGVAYVFVREEADKAEPWYVVGLHNSNPALRLKNAALLLARATQEILHSFPVAMETAEQQKAYVEGVKILTKKLIETLPRKGLVRSDR